MREDLFKARLSNKSGVGAIFSQHGAGPEWL
jgi:hypothetical protein